VNNEEANVMVGVREAYVTQSQSQATGSIVTSDTIEFIDVGVKLKLVPKIGADGFIIMKIKPEVSSVLRTDTLSDLTKVPIIQTSQSETVVKVKDGAMIMLAGMTRLEDADTIKGWPVLSKLPIVGAFFGYRTKTKKRTEIIIFLTPHLTTGSTGLRGDEITKILPRIYLPPDLQEKVDHDKAVDSKLAVMENPSAEKIVDPAETKAAQKGKQATEKAIKDAADKAQKVLEENKKAAEKAIKPPSAQRKKAAAAEEKAKKAADKLAKQAEARAAKVAQQEAAQAEKIAKAQSAAALKLSQEMAKEVAQKAKLVAEPKVSVIKVTKPELGRSAKDYFQKGLQAQADANPQEAINNFIQATKLDAKYASAYNSLGVVYEEVGKFDKAEKAYLKAVAVDQGFAPAYANLALFNESRKNYSAALEYWRKRALYGDPENPWTQQALERVKTLETKK